MEKLETLRDLVLRLAQYGERPAIVALTKDDRQPCSYAKLSDQARRVAGGLIKAGVRKGEYVALCGEGSTEWFSTCLGIMASGAIAAPLDTQLSNIALSHALRDCGARFVFTTNRLLKRILPVTAQLNCEPILLGGRAEGVRSWEDLFAERPEVETRVTPDDWAVLFYTSGTTGSPKGVPLTHRNLAFQLNSLLAADLVTAADRVLLPLPLHHVYAFTIGMLLPLTLGIPIVLPYSLTGPQVMRALRAGGVTIVVGVPRLYRALLAGIQSRAESGGRLTGAVFRVALALSTSLARCHIRVGRLLFGRIHHEPSPQLRMLASGGAAIEPDLAWSLEGLGWLVGIGYGLTETSPLLTINRPGAARIGSVGRVIPGVEVRIEPLVDRNGDRQTADAGNRGHEEGEVVARGPSVFAGYHGLPDETKQAFTDDGWFRTGDLGYLDPDGYLYITGRVKTLIVLEGGEKVQPDDLEEKLQQNPAIREVGVLERNRRIVAVIHPGRLTHLEHGPQHGDEDIVRTAIEERSRSLPSYQRIADFVITNAALPRTRLGKIRRGELQKLYDQIKSRRTDQTQSGSLSEDEMQPDDRALLDEPTARQTWEMLASRFSRHRLTPDSSLQLDLGIDSLEWLNLTLEIHRCCGVELDEDAISRIETVRDLMREVAEEPQGTGGTFDPLDHPDEVLGEEREHWLAPLGPVESAVATCLYILNRMLVRTIFRLSIKGRERLPKKGPFVLTPNHVSYLDSFVLAAALNRKLLQETYWAGWSGIAFGPIFRVLRRIAHVIPIDPEKAAASSLAFGAAILRSKRNLVWYPEGGHSKTGEIEALKPGIGLILQHYPVPVVPVSLHGTREALPPGRWLPRSARIEIAFGEPLDPRTLEQQGNGEEPHVRIVSALHDELVRLCRH